MSPVLAFIVLAPKGGETVPVSCLPRCIRSRKQGPSEGCETGTVSPLSIFQAEDPYAALGRSIPKEEFEAVYNYLGQPESSPPRFIPPRTTPFEAQRRTVDRYAPILAGLLQTSDQPYKSSALALDDFAAVKNLAKLALLSIHVRFADGDRHGAVTVILDGLKMARRIRGDSTLGALVGVACESIMLSSVDSHLDQISLPECDRLRAAADGVLAETVSMPHDAAEPVRRAFATPELWGQKDADPFLSALAKETAQMRLLRLHMRIEAYRWRNNRLPERLIDAAPASEVDDPLTHLPFRYEPAGLSYRLVSEGFLGLGPMGLKYRKDPKLSDPDTPPDLPPQRQASRRRM